MALKQNSKQVLDVYAGQVKKNAAEAYRVVHPTATDVTARTNAYKLMAKPTAQIYLQQHIDKAKERIVALVNSDNEGIALKASDSVLNRALGTPTQRTEVISSVVSINIDLTTQDEEEILDI